MKISGSYSVAEADGGPIKSILLFLSRKQDNIAIILSFGEGATSKPR
jgi:hypothetical protein